jgi:hypothetical protein
VPSSVLGRGFLEEGVFVVFLAVVCFVAVVGGSREAGLTPAALGAGVLAQVQEAAQPYAGLAGIPGRTVCRRGRPPCGEYILDGECGLVVAGRDFSELRSDQQCVPSVQADRLRRVRWR